MHMNVQVGEWVLLGNGAEPDREPGNVTEPNSETFTSSNSSNLEQTRLANCLSPFRLISFILCWFCSLLLLGLRRRNARFPFDVPIPIIPQIHFVYKHFSDLSWDARNSCDCYITRLSEKFFDVFMGINDKMFFVTYIIHLISHWNVEIFIKYKVSSNLNFLG